VADALINVGCLLDATIVIAHSGKEPATPIWTGGQDAFAACGPV
jgi:hypothetical protein